MWTYHAVLVGFDNFPVAHASHSEVPTELAYDPAGHKEHSVAYGGRLILEYLPLGQFTQTLFTNIWPAKPSIVGTEVGTGDGS